MNHSKSFTRILPFSLVLGIMVLTLYFASFKDQQAIYLGTFGQNWENWSWRARVDVANSENRLTSNTPLKVSLNPWGVFSLHHPDTDTTDFNRLEFYIYVGKNTDQKLYISLNDLSNREFKHRIKLPDPRYLEGGKFAVNRWQRVQIPLAELDAWQTRITRLNIRVSSKKYSRSFLIDQISLLGSNYAMNPAAY